MRISIPGAPGIYYDSDARSTALTVALTAASRRAPKPQGYAVQVLPYLWSFDVDLREVPNDHPLQYLHPEGAHSIEELTREQLGSTVGRDLEVLLRFAWAVNEETEQAFERLLGIRETEEGIEIEIEIDEGELEEPRDIEIEDAGGELGESADSDPDEIDEEDVSGTDEFRPDEL